MGEYLTTAEVAALLRVKPKTVRNKAASGVFRQGEHFFRKPGLGPRWKREAIVRFTASRLEKFRIQLLAERTHRGTKRTVKAARNIIDWHLRALWRDAKKESLAGRFPALDRPRLRRPKPDPFEPDERDRIIAWFAEHDPRLHPWVYFLFWTGMRHGEAAGLRWADVDLRRGVISVSRSRVEGEENEPKTAGSIRPVQLLPGVLSLLRELPRELHSDGSEYVFSDAAGKADDGLVVAEARGRSADRQE